MYIHIHIYIYIHMCLCIFYVVYLSIYMNGVQNGWSPIGCEGMYFHAMCKNRVSVSGWSPIGCECFRTNLKIHENPMCTPHHFSLRLILSLTHMIRHVCLFFSGQVCRTSQHKPSLINYDSHNAPTRCPVQSWEQPFGQSATAHYKPRQINI